MSISRNSLLLWLVLLLVACQSAPKIEPKQTVSAPTPTPATDLTRQAYQQAIQALKSGDNERALGLLQRISEDAPDTPYVFTNIGLAYFDMQQPEQAEIALQEALVHDPDDAVAHNHLGILHRQKGQFDEARKRYQRAIEIDSGYALAHLNLGILLDIYIQDLDLALQQYRRYQDLLDQEDSQVAGWIVDIERRLKSASASSQG